MEMPKLPAAGLRDPPGSTKALSVSELPGAGQDDVTSPSRPGIRRPDAHLAANLPAGVAELIDQRRELPQVAAGSGHQREEGRAERHRFARDRVPQALPPG
jgi:hypothetical protein